MIPNEMIILIVSMVIGGGSALFYFIRENNNYFQTLFYIPNVIKQETISTKEMRSTILDIWTGVILFFMLGYKLTPLINNPKVIMRPLELLFLRGGELGLLVGFLVALVYWVIAHLRRSLVLVPNWTILMLGVIASYTLYSLLTWEVYDGHYLGLYRGVAGLLFLGLIIWNRKWLDWLLMIYTGLILFIESLSYARHFWGFSLFQWFMLSLALIYFGLKFYNPSSSNKKEVDQ